MILRSDRELEGVLQISYKDFGQRYVWQRDFILKSEGKYALVGDFGARSMGLKTHYLEAMSGDAEESLVAEDAYFKSKKNSLGLSGKFVDCASEEEIRRQRMIHLRAHAENWSR